MLSFNKKIIKDESNTHYWCRKCGAKDSGYYRIIERNFATVSVEFDGTSFNEGDDYETQNDGLNADRDGVECKECGILGDCEGEIFTTNPETIKLAKGRQFQLMVIQDRNLRSKLLDGWSLLKDPVEIKKEEKRGKKTK